MDCRFELPAANLYRNDRPQIVDVLSSTRLELSRGVTFDGSSQFLTRQTNQKKLLRSLRFSAHMFRELCMCVCVCGSFTVGLSVRRFFGLLQSSTLGQLARARAFLTHESHSWLIDRVSDRNVDPETVSNH